MQQLEGDLIELGISGRFDVIVHGCNCFHTMGAGIARALSQRFPQVLAADRETPYGDRAKLGSFSHVTVEGGNTQPLIIVNAYTQFRPAGSAPLVNYDAVETVFKAIASRFRHVRIGYPLIGAGLGGGEWSKIAPRIDHALQDCDHCLVILPPS